VFAAFYVRYVATCAALSVTPLPQSELRALIEALA
jgi:hypothetical protein